MSGRPPPRSDSSDIDLALNPALEIVLARNKLTFAEENLQLASGACGAIAAVYQIAANRLSEIGTYRTGSSGERIGGSDQLTAALNRGFAFNGKRYQRPARDKAHKLAKKRAIFMFGIMFAGLIARELRQFHRRDEIPAALETREDFADQTA